MSDLFWSSYFSIGVGFYVGVSLCRKHTFKGATVFEILKGLAIGIILWPIVMFILARSPDDAC